METSSGILSKMLICLPILGSLGVGTWLVLQCGRKLFLKGVLKATFCLDSGYTGSCQRPLIRFRVEIHWPVRVCLANHPPWTSGMDLVLLHGLNVHNLHIDISTIIGTSIMGKAQGLVDGSIFWLSVMQNFVLNCLLSCLG